MSQEDIMGPAYEESRTTQGMKWLGRVIAVVIILAVAVFGDVMYIVLMTSHFPSGPLLIVCYIGALTSFLSTIYLLIGKTSLFTPGKQSVFAWLVLFVELVIIGLNIVLVFHGQDNNQFLQAWDWVAPATPVLNMCLVAILFFLDEEQIEKHKDMELQIKQNQMERRYKTAVFKAKIDLQHKQLDYLSSELQKAVNSPDSLAFIQQTALDMNAGLLSAFAGRSYGAPPSIEAGPGSGAVQLEQTATTALPPAEPKKGVLGKLKDWYNRPSGDDLEGQPQAESEVKTTQARAPRPFHAGQSTTGGAAAAGTTTANSSAQIRKQRINARRARKAKRQATTHQ